MADDDAADEPQPDADADEAAAGDDGAEDDDDDEGAFDKAGAAK